MKSIHIVANTLPEAFEKAIVDCWKYGDSFITEYDKPGDPQSKDCSMMIEIKDPMAEPRVHRNLCLGMNDQEKYRSEVIYGVHNYYMDDLSNPNRWSYTYNGRLFEYKVPCDCGHNPKICPSIIPCQKCGNQGFLVVNQIERCIEGLKKCGHSRRMQAITWMPTQDFDHSDPPCLQSLTFRIQDYDGTPKLNMNVRFRSNDLFKAWFSNALAITDLQKEIADRLGVGVGGCLWFADSMHIYGSYFQEIEGFLNNIAQREFSQRVWNTQDCIEFFVDGCDELLAEPNMPSDKKQKVQDRKAYLQGMLKG